MHFLRSRSLQTKLLILFLLGSLIPMLLLVFINTLIASENVETVARERIKVLTESTVSRIELFLAERQSDVQVFATEDTVRQSLQSLQERSEQSNPQDEIAFLTFARDAYNYDAIAVLDAQGITRFSTSEQLLNEDRSQYAEVQAALQGETAISQVRRDSDSAVPFVHYTTPIYDAQGEIIGAIDARGTLDALDDIVAFDTGHAGTGSYGVLLDEYGIRLLVPEFPDLQLVPAAPLEPQDAQRMRENNRFGDETADLLERATNLDDLIASIRTMQQSGATSDFFAGLDNYGTESQTAMQQLQSVPWFYAHRVPTTSFSSTVDDQRNTALLTTIITIAVAGTGIVLFSHRFLTRPLRQLLEGATVIEHGDLSRRLNIESGDEIGKLALRFNSMAESLENRMSAEKQAQQEARSLQETERSNRQILEQTVSDYLAFVQRVARGNLNQRLNVQQNGVLGQLGEGMNDMVASLREIASQVQESSVNIASAAAEIMAATTQQAASTSQQSAAITQATTTVEQIKTIALQTAHKAEQVSQESRLMLDAAQRGIRSVEETIAGMGKIRQQVEEIAQTILSLSDQTLAIGGITTTVSELADQSNMLALNAAIEAARAGEHGKSFAVVAQNVRDLAERSKAATGDVQQILTDIQRSTHAAVLVTEEGTKGVEEGVQRSSEAGEVIHQIVQEVEHGSQANSQISAAAHQQTTGIVQIGEAMQAIQQATTQVVASAHQAETAARDLNNLAQSLQDVVATYQI
jgi:methyl-accepting chemotaxis protein